MSSGAHVLGGHDQVAFVLTVLVVHDDDHPAGTQVLEDLVDGIEWHVAFLDFCPRPRPRSAPRAALSGRYVTPPGPATGGPNLLHEGLGDLAADTTYCARRYAMVAAACQQCEWSNSSPVFNIAMRSGSRPR